MHVAVDVGHGFVKAMSDRPDSTRWCEPALIGDAQLGADLGVSTTSITLDGTAHVVGDRARDSGATSNWTEAKDDQNTLRLIAIAGAAVGAEHGVDLAVGLPLEWWSDGRARLQRALEGRWWHVKMPGRDDVAWGPERVLVLPQGAAASSIVLGRQAPGTWLVVDIGWRTTDFLVARSYATVEIQPQWAGTVARAMAAVEERVAGEAKALTGWTGWTAEAVAGRDTVSRWGKTVDLRPARAKAAAAVGSEITAAIARRTDDVWDRLDGVILVGGGATVIRGAWPEGMPVVVADDPQWANVEGYLAGLRTLPARSAS